MLETFENNTPKIHQNAFVHKSAQVIGNVSMEEGSSIWPCAVARADINSISIGKNSNVQDNAVLHVIESIALKIGEGVTVGHGAILHACEVGDFCLIGMGSIVLDGAKIGRGSIVAAGSLVSPGKEFPENVLIMGSPAKIVRSLTDEEKAKYHNHYKFYCDLKDRF